MLKYGSKSQIGSIGNTFDDISSPSVLVNRQWACACIGPVV